MNEGKRSIFVQIGIVLLTFPPVNRVLVGGIILRYFATPETIKTFAQDIAMNEEGKRSVLMRIGKHALCFSSHQSRF